LLLQPTAELLGVRAISARTFVKSGITTISILRSLAPLETGSTDPKIRFNAIDLLIEASKGLEDYEKIDLRFDQLIRAPLQKQIDFDFADDRERFRERMQVAEPPALELVIFWNHAEWTGDGPERHHAQLHWQSGENREDIPSQLQEWFWQLLLLLGAQDEITKDVAVHPLTGDLPADAERLVKVEAKARPNEVGGPIRVILLDKNGLDKKNPPDSCPEPR